MWKRIKFYAVSLVIAVLGLTALYFYARYTATRGGVIHRTVDAPAVVQEIQRLSELVTVKYSIQKIVGLKEEKVPFGSEQVLLMVQATVLGGVDLTQLNQQDVTIDSDDTVTMKLPAPRIMHVYINDKETRVWDRSKTWWTPWVPLNPDLEQKARLASLEAVQQVALEMGIRQHAQTNAESVIRGLMQRVGFKSIRFQPPG